jgi:hypothetical protein
MKHDNCQNSLAELDKISYGYNVFTIVGITEPLIFAMNFIDSYELQLEVMMNIAMAIVHESSVAVDLNEVLA